MKFNKELFPKVNVKTDFIELTSTGVLTLKKGYAFDGVSGFPDMKSLLCGAGVHDALYQLIRLGHIDIKLITLADDEMIRICKKRGANKYLVESIRKVLKEFGPNFATKESMKPILYA